MLTIAWSMARAAGWGRSALLAGSTAFVSGLLLVAVSILKLDEESGEQLASFVLDDGTRPGVVFALVLVTVPPILLLHQVIHLGAAHRDRRLAALRVAGATTAQIRRLGALEVGPPVAVGAVAGLGVFAVLRRLLGTGPYLQPMSFRSQLAIVPASTTPNLVEAAGVVVFVAILGVAVGFWSSRRAARSPLGATRRVQQRPPRPWGLVLLGVAAALAVVEFSTWGAPVYLALVVVALVVLSLILLTPWIAYVIAKRRVATTSDPATLLAAQRIMTDPASVGRAAGAIGALGLIAGGIVGFVFELRASSGQEDPSYAAGATLAAIGVALGLFVATGSMAVHSIDALTDRKRETAFLAATGMTAPGLDKAIGREITTVGLPLAVVGAAIGSTVLPLIGGRSIGTIALMVLLGVALTVTSVWLAARLAVLAVRPWTRRAASPLNLRTE